MREFPEGAAPSASRLPLAKKQHVIISRAIERWRDTGTIDQETAQRLTGSIAVAPFDWRRTARYAFIISICCIVIAVAAILADKALLELLQRLFDVPAIAKCGFFALLSAAIFRDALRKRKRHPDRIYRNEAIFFLGVLALAAAVLFLGLALSRGTQHYSVLFLIASILYALLGLWFPSKQVWTFGLLSLGTWMGTETGYISGHGSYFLGMNYPLRFVIFGAALTGIGIAGPHSPGRDNVPNADSGSLRDRLILVSRQTKVVDLLNLFIALWIMSIFGNYGDMNEWHKVRQYELFHWALIFGGAAVAAVWYGLREDDGVLRGFGLTFLFINLYTRLFEYLWIPVHKAIFFALLAASFWYLGTRAEKIWNLGKRHR